MTQRDDLPLGQQCTLPGCEREAVAPERRGGLCQRHAPDETSAETSAEPESPDVDPACEAADLTDADALAAFEDAIAFFQTQLDRDLSDVEAVEYDTPQEYFTEGRGWEAATVAEKQLGYAPVNCQGELVSYLYDRGHDRGAILGTGLFYEDLTPHFRGRYVFPYFDADGCPVYAISRSADHPGDPKAGQKYTKAIKTTEYSHADEPIYGVETVAPGEAVLITEGIADAITAHEAGYPCLSPVTVQFKRQDRDRLAEILRDREIPRVYVVQDAEAPSVHVTDDATGWDALTIEQFGPGVRGAAQTAGTLANAGIDARIAELPRPGVDKVDVDDYLQTWSDDLTPILAAARTPDAHPAYDAEPADTAAQDQETTTSGAEATGDDSSALFDLELTDVAPVSEGERGKNPLGHHGGEKPWSENYFTVIDGDGEDGEVAYDHKYGASYNALTYLLCEAGERRANSPEGALDDDEVFAAWRHAKAAGHLTDDDPIPRAALRHVALKHDHCEADDVADGWRLPAAAYNAALATVADEYDAAPGRDPISADEMHPLVENARETGAAVDPGRTAAIPFEWLDRLSPAERRRAARKRGVEWPTSKRVEERIRETVVDVLAEETHTVVQAPTGSNKTGTAVETKWTDVDTDVTGDRPVVLLSETTDARDEAVERARENGLDVWVLQSYTELCPVAAGEYDPANIDADDPDAPEPLMVHGVPAGQWFEAQIEDKGIPLSVAHAEAEEQLRQQGRVMPCCAGDYICGTKTQWPADGFVEDGVARWDLIIATDPFGYVPSLRQETNIIHDEQPSYTENFGLDLSAEHSAQRRDALTARVQGIIKAYLREVAPWATWEAFVQLAQYDGYRGDAAAERDALESALDTQPDRGWYFTEPNAHTFAPALTRAVWYALQEDADANGRRSATVPCQPPRLDADAGDETGWNRTWVSVILDDENYIRSVRNAPDFSTARSVVGLDARPTPWTWQRNVHPDMDISRVLDHDEAACWRRYERGQTIVQVGDAIRPPGDEGEYFTEAHARALVDALADTYGDDFSTAGVPSAFEDEIEGLLREATTDPDAVETMHYGEEKSRNDFADETVGLVYGCIDPGDDYVLNWLAECGLDACPERSETCDTCEGAGCHECDDTGHHRAHGHGFVGPDADHAEALLESVRATHVAQMAGRFGRSLDSDAGERNLTFVATAAVPDDLVDYHAPGVEWTASELQRAIVDELRSRPHAPAREIADAADCTKEHVRQTLARLEDQGVVRRSQGTGRYGADQWCASPDAAVDDVQLRLDEIANCTVQEPCTWALAITAADDPPAAAGPAGTGRTRSDAPLHETPPPG